VRCTREPFGGETSSSADVAAVHIGAADAILVSERADQQSNCDDPDECADVSTMIAWVFDNHLRYLGRVEDERASVPRVDNGVLVVGDARRTIVDGHLVVPSSSAADAAMSAYRAAIAAYNAEGQADSYFAAYAPTLSCFAGRPNVSLDAVRAAHAEVLKASSQRGHFIAELTPVRVSDTEVTLLDRGGWWNVLTESEAQTGTRAPHVAHGDDATELGFHERIIVMRPVNGAWKIAAETDLAHANCITPSLLNLPVISSQLDQCRTGVGRCLVECDDMCSGPTGSNSCNECPEGCGRQLGECIGADAFYGQLDEEGEEE
jgi:hypothetical protein